MILSMKLSLCFTPRRKHIFKFRPEPERLQNLQRLQLNLVLLWHPDAGFSLIFFRKYFLNSLPHKLTSESFIVGFCC